MTAEHEDHGNTPAAWTTVITIIVGFTVGGIGVIIASIPAFIAGIVICILGVIAGKVMSMAGLGKAAAPDAASTTDAASTSDADAVSDSV